MEPHDRRPRASWNESAMSATSAPVGATFGWLLAAVLAVSGAWGTLDADGADSTPAGPEPAAAATAIQLPELLDLLRANLAGATPEELNRAAVTGLMQQLGSRVTLLEDGEAAPSKSPHPARGPAFTSTLHDRSYGYVRLSTLSPETASGFSAAFGGLSSTNKLQGLVLDLRFCSGGDYAAAVNVADAFFSGVQDLVDWGEGMKRSTAKSNVITLPTTVLVNRQTSGAAEVLAGILRQGEAALLVGTNTAGQAGITREFALKTGQRVRVAVAPVKVVKGEELPFTGLVPDIVMSVDPQEERLSMADAYRVVRSGAGGIGTGADTAQASTNARPRRRMNEAELVRMAREGQDPREITGTTPALKPVEPAEPAVTDPVLARALDILKGLAVVQRVRGL